jgi:hypothetical protein
VGTWKANIAKSSKSPNLPKSEISKIEAIDNGFKTIRDVVSADGKTSHSEGLFRFDGKEYPYTWPGSTAIFTKIDDSRYFCVVKRDGKEIGRMFNVISSDGRTGTLIFMGRNPQGQDYVNTLVYDKQ